METTETSVPGNVVAPLVGVSGMGTKPHGTLGENPMDSTEYEQFQDNLEDIEISDLPGPEFTPTTDADLAVLRPPTRLSLGPRFSPRQRALQATATTLVVVVVVLLILGNYAPTRNAAIMRLISLIPTPTPTLAPGDDLFYLQGTFPWSKVSLDGHRLALLPVISGNAPLRLTRGSHQFTWQADPFQPITCSLSVPAGITDTCKDNDIAATPSGMEVKIITFLPTLMTLPIAQRTALIQTAQATLDTLQSSEVVQPGERFFDPQHIPFDLTTQPLRATLRFELDTNTATRYPCKLELIGKPCRSAQQDCRVFCTLATPPQSASSPQKIWDVVAGIRSVWAYTTLDGHVVLQNQPDVIIEHTVSLQILWDGTQWHVSLLPGPFNIPVADNLACTLARDSTNLTTLFHFAEGDPDKAVDWYFAPASTPAAGCLAVATLDGPTPSTALAYCLYRFGVLLAANSTAQLYWSPIMPVANAYEQSLAQSIATLTTSQALLPHG